MMKHNKENVNLQFHNKTTGFYHAIIVRDYFSANFLRSLKYFLIFPQEVFLVMKFPSLFIVAIVNSVAKLFSPAIATKASSNFLFFVVLYNSVAKW